MRMTSPYQSEVPSPGADWLYFSTPRPELLRHPLPGGHASKTASAKARTRVTENNGRGKGRPETDHWERRRPAGVFRSHVPEEARQLPPILFLHISLLHISPFPQIPAFPQISAERTVPRKGHRHVGPGFNPGAGSTKHPQAPGGGGMGGGRREPRGASNTHAREPRRPRNPEPGRHPMKLAAYASRY